MNESKKINPLDGQARWLNNQIAVADADLGIAEALLNAMLRVDDADAENPNAGATEKAADEEVVRVLVHPHEDIGKQGAEPEGAEVGEARAREREARPPWVEQPQEGRRHRRDGKLLGHERPGAESCQRDANAHDRSCGYAREEAQLEAAERTISEERENGRQLRAELDSNSSLFAVVRQEVAGLSERLESIAPPGAEPTEQ